MNNQFTHEEFIKLKGFLDAWDWCIELGINFYDICPDSFEGNGEYDSHLYFQDN